MSASPRASLDLPRPLEYFAPTVSKTSPSKRAPLLSFVFGFVAAAGGVSFLSNFVLRQYNSYLQWDLCFVLDVIFAVFGACLSAGAIAIAAVFIHRRLHRLCFPRRIVMFAIGAIDAALVTIPHVVDVIATGGGDDDSGNPISTGWGGSIGVVIFMIIPIVVIAFIWARSFKFEVVPSADASNLPPLCIPSPPLRKD